MIELTDVPKVETDEDIKKRKHEEFFAANMDRLMAFHDKWPKEPPPVRWDESTKEWKWTSYPNREQRRKIILTDG